MKIGPSSRKPRAQAKRENDLEKNESNPSSFPGRFGGRGKGSGNEVASNTAMKTGRLGLQNFAVQRDDCEQLHHKIPQGLSGVDYDRNGKHYNWNKENRSH